MGLTSIGGYAIFTTNIAIGLNMKQPQKVIKFGLIPTKHGLVQRYRDRKGNTFYRKEDYVKKTTKSR